MAEATYPGVVVPAIPPRPPQITLINSSVRPTDTSDPSGPIFQLGADQLALLPSGLKDELIARKGDAWVRGFNYLPENHSAAEIRDQCDFTSINAPPLPAPLGLAAKEVAGGTLGAASYEYKVTAKNANGETTANAAVKITTSATGSITLTWGAVASTAQYIVYGRLAGVFKVIATVGPFDEDQPVQFVDTGATAPAGKSPPSTNTTGGIGSYSNLPPVEYVPFLVLAFDRCSSFGFEEHDYKGRALRLLDNSTPEAVEREYWTGALAEAKGYPNNSLMNSAKVSDLTPTTVPSVERGLAILQDALANCGFGGQGMIHVQPQTTSSLLKVRRVGPQLYDIFDNIVVPGVGYPGTGPGGKEPKPGNAYIGASDLVMTRIEEKGTIFPSTFAEALDWGQGGEPNTIQFAAQRYAAAYFDGACQFACEVKLPE